MAMLNPVFDAMTMKVVPPITIQLYYFICILVVIVANDTLRSILKLLSVKFQSTQTLNHFWNCLVTEGSSPFSCLLLTNLNNDTGQTENENSIDYHLEIANNQ